MENLIIYNSLYGQQTCAARFHHLADSLSRQAFKKFKNDPYLLMVDKPSHYEYLNSMMIF
jgi:hypothetical protein